MLKKAKTRENKNLSAPQNCVTYRNRRVDKAVATSPLTSILRSEKESFES
jgi:hypothetical protein